MNIALPRGLLLKDYHPIATIDGDSYNSIEFEQWLNDNNYDEIICIDKKPSFDEYVNTTDNRSMSENFFYENVIVYPNVVCVGSSKLKIQTFSSISSEFQGCLNVVQGILLGTWNKIEVQEEYDYCIADIDGENIIVSNVTIIRKR